MAALEVQKREKRISTGFSTRICRWKRAIHLHRVSNVSSDGPTPEAKTQQILAITQIVQGQKPSQHFNIPPVHQQQPQEPPQQSLNPTQAGGNDLIDFGQGAPSTASTLQQQKPQQHYMHQETAPQGLQQPLEPAMGQPVHRVDTATHELDEFVDAEDGR